MVELLADAIRLISMILIGKSVNYWGELKQHLTEEEIVTVLDISQRTVRRDWNFAKAWLSRELSRGQTV